MEHYFHHAHGSGKLVDMTRFFILTLLNLMLPFLLRAGYIYMLRVLHRRREKQQDPRIIDVTPPKWHFPVIKLLSIGLILLFVSLMVLRFSSDTPPTDWHQANPAQSVTFD